MMRINPLTSIDFYKADHRRQYAAGTTEVYSNLTPRSSKSAHVLRHRYDETVVFFGLQYFLKHFLIDAWNHGFFQRDKQEVVDAYQRRMQNGLGVETFDVSHIEALHDLGYLPIRLKALPEGSKVPIGVPVLTIVNTHPDFFWLTNYIETVIQCYMWKPITSATIAYEYKKLLCDYASMTGTPQAVVPFQSHDFSFRGAAGMMDAVLNGAGHLTSFVGTDTVAAIDFMEEYYGADSSLVPLGCAVPATEHSVMCLGGEQHEIDTIRRLINEVYPTGIVSVVADTWDFWSVMTDMLPELKQDILARDGRVVIRPDSGDPIKIVCGDPTATKGTPAYKGAIECLWDLFGGTKTDKGYQMLDEHIGLIYGDSITIERAEKILEGLAQKGFASGNILFGVGSLTYQSTIRDTFGFAMKATSGIVDGERRVLYKDPKTDSGTKRSARGLLRVSLEDGRYVLHQDQTEEQEAQGELTAVFENGKLLFTTTLDAIRAQLACPK